MENLIIKIAKSEKEIADAKDIRREVFQVEQKIDSKLDFDGKDNEADLIIVYSNDQPIGTGRIRYIESNMAKIERVSVLSEFRKKRIGEKIMNFIMDYLIEKNVSEIILDAQLQARDFYEKLGYQQKGDIFEEVGKLHIVMVKTV